jgi:hypothetical protein
MPSQRRRIQRMRAQKIREEATEKKRDEYINVIQLVILTKQEWRVKEKVNTPAPMTSDDDMDLLDDDEASLIKDGSPPPTGMYINIVFSCWLSSGALRRRSLRCVSSPRRSCSRSLKCRAST